MSAYGSARKRAAGVDDRRQHGRPFVHDDVAGIELVIRPKADPGRRCRRQRAFAALKVSLGRRAGDIACMMKHIEQLAPLALAKNRPRSRSRSALARSRASCARAASCASTWRLPPRILDDLSKVLLRIEPLAQRDQLDHVAAVGAGRADPGVGRAFK